MRRAVGSSIYLKIDGVADGTVPREMYEYLCRLKRKPSYRRLDRGTQDAGVTCCHADGLSQLRGKPNQL